ncbi:MAG TPA: ABC transporter ATP-binding protein [Candidatus Dormibacteraeota bacterium]|jgi:branched-chain amino acid transport system ATP-binding protein|nr:ABC transporter ATP-binding protein [Candidatus Dormibacteraeota bacterium]
MALLEIERIDASYGHVRALRGVSLRVEQGEIVALIGSNGAGKTTTLRTVSGLVRPSGGRILFDGRDITRTRPSDIVKLGIGHAPEGRRLFSRLTVQDNLLLGAFTRRDRAGIEEDLERVYALFPRVRERRTQIAGTLSGGEQQMLAVGRALMARPRLLMLDEPSLGLAPLLQETIFRTLVEINAQGTPVLLVEQNANRALEIAHRAYVLETGSIVMQGTGRELLASDEVQRAYLGM